MKCLYAIPSEAVAEAQRLCEAYASALSSLSEETIGFADELRAFAEARSAAVIKIDDEDWSAAKEALSERDAARLSGELFWSSDAAGRARLALVEIARSTSKQALDDCKAAGQTHRFEESAYLTTVRAVAAWLGTQVKRGRSVVLVAA
jgi:hypothetical protein